MVTNNSTDLTVPLFTLDRTFTTLGKDIATGLILPTGAATRAVAADGAGFADVSLTWAQARALGGYADLTVALKNGSTVIDQRRESDGSISFLTAVPAAGTYSVVITDNSPASDVPSYTLTTRVPRVLAVTVTVALEDSNNATVASATGMKPRTLNTTAAPGSYTLVVTPAEGRANATLAASYPTYAIATGGRRRRHDVPRRRRLRGDHGVVEAHPRPRRHRGEDGSAGAFTAASVTDAFGLGTTVADPLGWLGGHSRFGVGGSLGIIRMGVRLYDPTIGRFLQTDPIEGGSCIRLRLRLR